MGKLHILKDKTILAAIKRAQTTGNLVRLSDGGWLTLLATPTGAGRWQQRYRYGGKPRTVSHGTYPAVTLSEAREQAHAARELLKQGIDPVEHRRAKKAALRDRVDNTFGAAANAWYAFNAPRWAQATRDKAQEYLRKDLRPALGNRPLDSVTSTDLSNVIGKIEKRGAYNVAKKCRQWLNGIFRYAIAKEWTKENPAQHLGAIAAHTPRASRYPHLTPSELPQLLAALDAYTGSPLTKGAIWLALWTANRPGVTRTLRWHEADLDAGLWTIEPGREHMKLGYAHVSPLPRQAVTMLRDLHKLTGTFEWVFPGRNDPHKPMSDAAVNKALAVMGFKGRQTAHGFRHLVSTALNERGHDPDHVERQLAHGDPDKVRGVYNEATYLPQRKKMMQAWADELDAMLEGKTTVTPIRKRRQA